MITKIITLIVGHLMFLAKFRLAYESIIGTIKVTYDSLKSTVIKPSDITGNKEFKKYKNAFNSLSSTMLAIFLMWQILKIYSMRYVEPDGDGFW